MFHRFLGLMVGTVVIMGLLAGCGGGSGGQAAIVFDWPADASVASAGVVVYEGALVAGSRIINRPAVGTSSTFAFSGIEAGVQRFYFCTYDTPNGSGDPTGFAHGEVDVATTGNIPARVTTVGDPAATFTVSCPRSVIYVGDTVQCTGSLLNPDGSYAVIAMGRLYWTTQASSIASVDTDTGVVKGKDQGTTRITASFGQGGSPSAYTTVRVADRPSPL